MKILIVDDTASEREYLKSILQEHEIFEASCGESALESVNGSLPDLIIMDDVMPNLNGFDALKKLKRNSTTKNIPVIMTSNRSMPSDIFYAKRLGASEFLTKPFNREKVLEVLKIATIPYFKDTLEKELKSSNSHQEPRIKI